MTSLILSWPRRNLFCVERNAIPILDVVVARAPKYFRILNRGLWLVGWLGGWGAKGIGAQGRKIVTKPAYDWQIVKIHEYHGVILRVRFGFAITRSVCGGHQVCGFTH